MANWMGGSAPAMAGQVEGGFILLSSNNLKGFLPPDLQLLRAELEKALRTALRALQANPLRTLLTLLGVMIGVGSVVAMLAFGNGARRTTGSLGEPGVGSQVKELKRLNCVNGPRR